MRRATLLCVIVAFPMLLSAQGVGPSRTTVLNHVTVIDVNGSPPRRDMAVVITGNRIAAVDLAGRVRVPPNAQTIDASGTFVVPGLADMHHHLDTGFSMPGSPGSGRVGPPEFRQHLAQMLGWGFTTIFSPAFTHPDLKAFTSLRTAASNDAAPLARYFGVGRAITVKGGHASQPPVATYLPDTPDEARQNVRELKAAGVDAVKFVYEDLAWHGTAVPVMRPEVMQAIIGEAHALGLRAYVHAPNLRHAKEVLRAGADGLVHSVVDAPIDDEFIGLMKKNRASYTTTLSVFAAFADVAAWMQRLEGLNERGVIPKEVFDAYKSPDGARNYYTAFGTMTKEQPQYLRSNVRKVVDAGILVVSGTDTSVPGVLLGVSSQMELVLLVEAGLTPTEALRAATINAAKMLGRENDQGTVEVGKLADLVVLDADPLANIRNISKIYRVIKGGVIYDPAQLLAANR